MRATTSKSTSSLKVLIAISMADLFWSGIKSLSPLINVNKLGAVSGVWPTSRSSERSQMSQIFFPSCDKTLVSVWRRCESFFSV